MARRTGDGFSLPAAQAAPAETAMARGVEARLYCFSVHAGDGDIEYVGKAQGGMAVSLDPRNVALEHLP